MLWFYVKNNFQVLVTKCWVGLETSFVITIIILQELIVLSDFDDLAGEILRLFDFHHKERHPIKHL